MSEEYEQVLIDCPNRVIGYKQVLHALSSRQAQIVVLASDADEPMRARIQNLCRATCVSVLFAPSKKQLGVVVGIDVGAAVVAVLSR